LVFFQLLLWAHLWALLLLPLSLCSCLGGLASEPGVLAYCCCAVLALVSRPCTSYVGLYMLLLLIIRSCFS
jgi:hypothetical protein